jgi:hypothetical protein
MARNSAEQSNDLSEVQIEKQDSQQITDLIEQLECDLKETRKNAGKELNAPTGAFLADRTPTLDLEDPPEALRLRD